MRVLILANTNHRTDEAHFIFCFCGEHWAVIYIKTKVSGYACVFSICHTPPLHLHRTETINSGNEDKAEQIKKNSSPFEGHAVQDVVFHLSNTDIRAQVELSD